MKYKGTLWADLDKHSQEEYEKALKEFHRRQKKEALKQYADIIKNGNRKAVDKAKEIAKAKKKKGKSKSLAVIC